ncbi:hypothetical protein C3392_28460, partial [Klebsiella pneumoniae]
QVFQQVRTCAGERQCRFIQILQRAEPFFLPNLSGVTDDNGQHGVQNGGVSGNPRKFRHSALWNFLGGWSAA